MSVIYFSTLYKYSHTHTFTHTHKRKGSHIRKNNDKEKYARKAMADKNFLYFNIFNKSLVGIKKLGLEVVNERG